MRACTIHQLVAHPELLRGSEDARRQAGNRKHRENREDVGNDFTTKKRKGALMRCLAVVFQAWLWQGPTSPTLGGAWGGEEDNPSNTTTQK